MSVGCAVLLLLLLLLVSGWCMTLREHFAAPGPPLIGYPDFAQQPVGRPPSDEGGRSIPPVLFRTARFKLAAVPSVIVQHATAFQAANPATTQVYADDEDCASFISMHFPRDLEAYYSLLPPAFRADVWRLMALYVHGGVYCDVGCVFLRPLGSLLDEADEFVAVVACDDPRTLYTGFMAAHPRNPVVLAMLQHVLRNVRMRLYGETILDITGPMAVARALKRHLGMPDGVSLHPGVVERQGRRIKLVQGVWPDGPTDIENLQFITNLRGDKVIQNKFSGYYQIVYRDAGDRYAQAWHDGRVFG